MSSPLNKVDPTGRALITRDLPVGSRWFHPKTGGLYRITGLVFHSQAEVWMVLYQREGHEDEVERGDEIRFDGFCHTPEDFLREGRFLRVKD